MSRSTRYLFFDTETSGLPRQMDAPVSRLENWPRVVQLAWILTDFQGRVISQRQYLIQPTGWRMQPGALKVHGITLAHARRHGYPLPDVLHRFALDLLQTDSIIGHNVQFDQKILGAEFLRLGQTNPLQRRHAQCTMKMGAVFLQRRAQSPAVGAAENSPPPVHQDSLEAAPTENAPTGGDVCGVDSCGVDSWGGGSVMPLPAAGPLEVATSVESAGDEDPTLVAEAASTYRIDLNPSASNSPKSGGVRGGDSRPGTGAAAAATPSLAAFAGSSHRPGIAAIPNQTAGARSSPVEGATWRDSGTGFRYPSLRRLHRTLFGFEFDNAHDALADTQACLNCFFEMCRDSSP